MSHCAGNNGSQHAMDTLDRLRPCSRLQVSTDLNKFDGLGITEDTTNLDTLEATDLDALGG